MYGSHSYGSRAYGSKAGTFIQRTIAKGAAILRTTLEFVITPFRDTPAVTLQSAENIVTPSKSNNVVLSTKNNNTPLQ